MKMEKKKNKFLSNKGFVIFSILALLIVLMAIFAPALCGGRSPTAGSERIAGSSGRRLT